MRRILSLLLVAVVVAGCSNDEKSIPEPGTPAAGPVKAMKHADAQALADKYRTEAVDTLGTPLSGTPTSNLMACEGTGTFTAITYGDVPVPAAQQPAALQKLRDHYTSANYTVAPAPTDGTNVLNATTADRVMITIDADSPDTLRVNVATPCYSSDEPL
ncbi:lipoprotein [Dactylosporangium sp. CS-033363]|uniref:lipoprotein n=1 Tax=Dactylosporangium sp. CS-033363 TaxID=3239935 RepID=UPI003D8A0349